MIQRVLLVAWKTSAATQWVPALQAAGYMVFLEDTTGDRAWRIAKERGIQLVVIDGQKKPSHGISTGDQLRDTKKTQDLPIVWSNLNPENEVQVREKVRPEVLLTAPTEVESVLQSMRLLQPQQRHPAELGVAAPPNLPAPKPPSPSAIIPTPPKVGSKISPVAWTPVLPPPAPPVPGAATANGYEYAAEPVAAPAAVAVKPAPAKAAARPAAKKPAAKAPAKKPTKPAPARKAPAAKKPAAKARRS